MNLRVERGFDAWLIMDGKRHLATVYGTEAEAKAFAAGYRMLKGPIIEEAKK